MSRVRLLIPDPALRVAGRSVLEVALATVQEAGLATAPDGALVWDATRLALDGDDLAWLAAAARGAVVDPTGAPIATLGEGGDRRTVDVPDLRAPGGLDATERALRARHAARAVARGVRIADPARTTVDPTVSLAPGCRLWPDVTLLGNTVVEAGAEVQSGCWLEDTHVAAGAVVRPYSVCTGARIGPGALVGPFAHLRAGTVLERDVKVGNFVEVKATVLRAGAKASHLSYLGDAEVGADANVGAGTITCNYDGYGKHHTAIGARAFIGSNSALVAPVRIGDGAIVGAGSVITQDVPEESLAVERAPLRILPGKAPSVRHRNATRAGKEP